MAVDDQHGGAPVGAPGVAQREPGWYDDPWNAANIRRWDGEEWTGETAPKPAAAPGAPSSRARRRRRVNPLAVVGAVAAVAVVAVVVVASGHSSAPSSSPSTVTSAAPTSAAPTGLPSAVLAVGDLGSGWTAVESRPLTAAEYTRGPCGSALWAHDTAGYLSSFVKGASAATAHGSVIARVAEAPSPAVVDQQQVLVNTSAFVACQQQTVAAEVRSQLPAGQSVASSTISPFSLQLPIPSRAFVVNVTVAQAGGGQRVVTDNAVVMFSGQYMATVDVSWSSDAPLGGQIVQQEAAYEAAHLAALTSSS